MKSKEKKAVKKPLSCKKIRQISPFNLYPLYFQHVPFVRLSSSVFSCLIIKQGLCFSVLKVLRAIARFSSGRKETMIGIQERMAHFLLK
jgi:hypothetical protein